MQNKCGSCDNGKIIKPAIRTEEGENYPEYIAQCFTCISKSHKYNAGPFSDGVMAVRFAMTKIKENKSDVFIEIVEKNLDSHTTRSYYVCYN